MTTRNHMLRVRFSAAEWESLQKLSESAGMTMSEVVRAHLGKVRVRNRRDEKARVAMLNRINANLNMIARWANTRKKSGRGRGGHYPSGRDRAADYGVNSMIVGFSRYGTGRGSGPTARGARARTASSATWRCRTNG